MPWNAVKSSKCPAAKPWAVVKKGDGSIVACHPTQDAAHKQMAALYANEKKSADPEVNIVTREPRPPRDNLIRALYPAVELRASEDVEDNMPTMIGHFAKFNEWTHIHSLYEGEFMERVAPGAFTKTFAENRDNIRVLFQHGNDPQIGDKPLGAISDLSEDADGARYEVPLLDTAYNRELLPGLKAGLYGASFRFRVTKEDYKKRADASTHNPDALPERTVQEADVFEFGPVTFPAYAGATAGIRSMTDDWIIAELTRDPERLRALLATLQPEALPSNGAAETHSDEGSREALPSSRRFKTREEYLAWISRI